MKLSVDISYLRIHLSILYDEIEVLQNLEHILRELQSNDYTASDDISFYIQHFKYITDHKAWITERIDWLESVIDRLSGVNSYARDKLMESQFVLDALDQFV